MSPGQPWSDDRPMTKQRRVGLTMPLPTDERAVIPGAPQAREGDPSWCAIALDPLPLRRLHRLRPGMTTYVSTITQRLLNRFRSSRDGSTAVEFALAAPVFLFLLMGILQIGLLFLASQHMEHGTSEAARLIRTGEVSRSVITQAGFRTRLCERIRPLLSCDANLMVDVQTVPSFNLMALDPPTDGQGNYVAETYKPGTAGDMIIVRVFYQYPVWLPFVGETLSNLPNGRRLIAASAVFRNENF
jgi:Flp pilus assembly protein TadG